MELVYTNSTVGTIDFYLQQEKFKYFTINSHRISLEIEFIHFEIHTNWIDTQERGLGKFLTPNQLPTRGRQMTNFLYFLGSIAGVNSYYLNLLYLSH